MATHLTVEQRLDWLTVRIAELELWVAREWVGLTDWTFDGAPLAVGAPWPERGGVHRLAHARVTPPWPDARLELDDRGRAVRGPGHRFAGLAGPGFGVAILNDGRYGHHALGSELGLSLLRSPIWPDPLADEGEQELVYALLPHVTDAELLAEAEDLNRPLLVHPSAALRGGAHWGSPDVPLSARSSRSRTAKGSRCASTSRSGIVAG